MRHGSMVIALLVAGCATQAGFDARMQALVGTAEGDLVHNLGVPDSDFTSTDGRRFLQYWRLGTRAPSPAPVVGFGFGGYGWGGAGWGYGVGTGFANYAPPPECRVTFEMRDGRVASYTREGAGCVARE